MLNFLRIEFLSFLSGFKELVYSLAEKLDYRVKSFKISLQGTLIEKDMERVSRSVGKKALSYYQKNQKFPPLNIEMFQHELQELQLLKERYSQSLQELSLLHRKALKETLSDCTEQFNRSGWGLTQINIPDSTKFIKVRIKEIPLKQDILILMIKKGNRMELVHGDTLLEGGDSLICIGSERSLIDFKNLMNQRA